ncbi:MAG: alpha/beta hydrolase [Bacteriovoracaceae bacterium]
MKNYFALLFSFLLFSCSHNQGTKENPKTPEVMAPTSMTIPKVVVIATPVAQVTPLPTPVPTPEWVSLDDEYSAGMKPLLNTFYKEDFADTRNVDVYVATNRKAKNKSFGCSDDQFGVEIDAATQFGMCKVNVPKNHIIGQITLAKNNRQSSHDFYKILQSRGMSESSFIESLKKSKRTPLVFIHGFNVRFQEAILRAAQITYDLKYQGPVVIFSWPSGAGDGFFDENFLNKTYENNSKTALGSIEPLKKFLIGLKANGLKINLAVHSMGHQVVLPALKVIGVKDPEKSFINELILNAPDFEANEFTDLTDIIKNICKRITLYCSYNDKAMIASKTMNKNERLGACTYSENVDSINVSLIDGGETFALGHGYYSSRAILNDVFQLLLGIDAEKRLFIKRSEPNSTEKYFLRP